MNSTTKHLLHVLKGTVIRHFPFIKTCQEYDAFLHDYVDNSLPAAQRRRFQFHLSICPECREFLAAYKRTMELDKLVHAEAIASFHADAPESLKQAILDARQS
jgi:anti-sigma factor RsiW